MGSGEQSNRGPGIVRRCDPDIDILLPGLAGYAGWRTSAPRYREGIGIVVGARSQRGTHDPGEFRGHATSKNLEIRIRGLPVAVDSGDDGFRRIEQIKGKEADKIISIVIPAYNEEKRIKGSLSETCAFLNNSGWNYEIIVVDDGSSDGTSQIVESMVTYFPNVTLVRYEKNKGKGHALRTGVLLTKGDFVLVMDADLSTPIEELQKLMPHLSGGGFDIAIGSRALALSDIIKKQPWWRRGMGKTFNQIVKMLVIGGFSDTQCGFKLFTGDVARNLFLEAKIDRFAYDVEILARAKRKGCGIKEVPIRWIDSPESRVDPMKDSLKMLADLVRIRFMVGKIKG